jgi:hypothetical protein
MKYKGKAISASSLLTILGVVCFATVIVAAAVLTSGMINFASTTVNGSIGMTTGSAPGAVNTGVAAVYGFNATVPDDMTGTVLTVQITGTGLVAGDITSITLNYNGTIQSLVGPVSTSNTLTWTYTVGAQIDAVVPIIVTVVYATAGTYTVGAQLVGTVA